MSAPGARLVSLALACALAASLARVGAAQAPAEPPLGPADIMNRAAQGRARSELERAARAGEAAAAQTKGDAAVAEAAPPARAGEGAAEEADEAAPAGEAQDPGASAAPSGESPGAQTEAGAAPQTPEPGSAAPHPSSPHGRDPRKVLAEPELPSAQPKPGSRAGSIEIDVFGPSGAPQPNAEIVLGIMASMGGRTEQRAKSDAAGRYVFRDLPVGSKQAYRVNVLYAGAKFSSTPFRLPEDVGYRVRVPLRGVTSDHGLLFQVVGQTVIELRDDRLHVTQQARLANAGERVIVLPKDGLVVPLPTGFTAFHWQDQMSDQRGEELSGKGFRLRGSLPPGTVNLAWTFDLERDGASAKIPVQQPWRTYTYRVIAEAPEGLKLRVSEFPEPERVRDHDRDLWFTQLQRRPSEQQLRAFTIRIEGIPGPGPGRWLALGLALTAIGVGLSRALRPADDAAERRKLLAARKAELLALARATDGEHERGEIGPQYRAERMNEIVTELALVLRDEELLAGRKAPSAA